MPVIGTIGLFLRAKRDGLLATIRPVIEALEEVDFWVSPTLRAEALRRAREEG